MTLIDHSGKRVRIETSRGTLTAGKVIVTVPTNLIADEAIRFHPPLPAKVDAARGLPLGLADKVMLALDEPRSAAQGRQSARRHHAHRRWAPIICARSASPASKAFSAAVLPKRWKTPATARWPRKASTRSSRFLGNDYRRKLKPLAESRWAHDPFARGSYSHALPGHAGAREVLAAPVDGRLFFAGEATSPDFFSTAHGARDSGERAAEEVLAALARN